MAENKLAKIPKIDFIEPQMTKYGLALDGVKKWGDVPVKTGMIFFGASGLSIGLMLIGVIFSLEKLWFFERIIRTFFLLASLCQIPTIVWRLRGGRRDILANPAKRFAWHLAKRLKFLTNGLKCSITGSPDISSDSRKKMKTTSNESTDCSPNRIKYLRAAWKRTTGLKRVPLFPIFLWNPNSPSCSANWLKPNAALCEHINELKSDDSPAGRLLANEAELNELAGEEVRALLAEKT